MTARKARATAFSVQLRAISEVSYEEEQATAKALTLSTRSETSFAK
jgi:hypothetical protein